MGILGRLFGKERHAHAASRAEAAGDLARASELYALAGRPDEAARVLLLRADAELDPKQRLLLLGQAISQGGDSKPGREASLKRAQVRIELAKSGALAASLRHDLREAAADLERLGEAAAAAEAYRLLGDDEGRTRALVQAGDVEELEYVLHEDVRQERVSRELRAGASRIETLMSTGDRRSALRECEALVREHPADASIKERLDLLRATRLVAPAVSVRMAHEGREERWRYVLGREIKIGRSEGEIQVPHGAVSRLHVRIYRDDAGMPHVEDLGSRNGTTMRGARLGGALAISSSLELALGGEVPLRVSPHGAYVLVEVAGESYVAPLGPAHLYDDDWELVSEADGWLALRTTSKPAFIGNLTVAPLTQLLAGDAFARERGGAVVLVVER